MAENETQAPQEERQIAVNGQYIKDLSFENPGAPQTLANTKERPDIDVSVDVKAGAIGDDIFEVALTLSCKAVAGEEKNTLFVCELTYGGVFTIKGVPDAEKEPALLVFCPNLLFPFARRIVADSTRDGGFPPLLLDPIDFGRLYAQRKQQGGAEAAAN